MPPLKIPMWTSPLAMACDLDPNFRMTPALRLIDAKLVEAYRTPRAKLLLSMAPQEGKTVSIAKWFPIWMLWLNRTKRIVYASYDLGLSRTVQGQTRDAVKLYENRLGMTLNKSYTAKQEWQTAEGGGVLAVGVGTGLSGRPADVMIIDDPLKGAREADSPTMRENLKLWWQSVASARLAPGAPVVVLQTRYHEDDLIGWLASQTEGEQWDYLNIPTQAEDADDILGRQPGEYMISARGRTKEEWDQRKVNAGSRMWQAMFQGRPSPAAGGILKREWWRRYDQIPWIQRTDGSRWVMGEGDELMISVDCAFKGTDQNDFVVIQTWMRRGVHMYLLDQTCRQMDFVETCDALVAMALRWPQAALKVIEEAANGPAVMSTLRNRMGGIVGEIPQGSKIARANATAPYLEAGNILLPASELTTPEGESFAWVEDFIEEASMFPNATHDDRVDAYTQAVNRLLIQPLEGEVPDTRTEEEQWQDIRGYSISPF